ncbi:Asp-tRNA(Asn)/Glu-tRNA(Gln) amidotransferase subunit GatC [Nanoarchaeota archaeon]
MEVNEELVKHVAELARLKFSDEEIKKFVPEFKEILEAFSKLDEVDTKGIKSSFQPVELKDVMREDKVDKSFTVKEALKNSEHIKEDQYFKGPKAV